MKILKGTSVLTDDGYKKIEDIDLLKDKLLYNNELVDIESINKENYDGDVYEIKKRIGFSNDPFLLLPENRIVVLDEVTRNTKDKRLFNKHEMIVKFPEDIHIDENRRYDMIVNPKINLTNDNKFNLTEPDCRLIGIILGDGCVHRDKRSNSRKCQISLGYSKEKTMTFVKKYLNERNICYRVDDRNNCEIIIFTCTKISWLNRDYFYDDNKQKFIHNDFKNLPHELLIQILRGLVETDGCRYYKEPHGQNLIKYSSSSLKLIYDMMYISRKFGMIVGGGQHSKKGSIDYIDGNKAIRNYDNYVITIPLQFIELLQHFDYFDEVLINAFKYFNIYNNKSLERILKINKFKLETSFYNITVKNKKYIHTLNGIIS